MLEKFELMQIWITDPSIGDLATKQFDRMVAKFETPSIPLHVILAPDGTELARFTYSPIATADDYVKFLEDGLAKFTAR